MKKLVRCHPRKILIRRKSDRRRVGMLHPASPRSFSDVKDERVMLEGRALHQGQLIRTNALQLVFNLFPSPSVSMHHHGYVRRYALQVENLKSSDFDRGVR